MYNLAWLHLDMDDHHSEAVFFLVFGGKLLHQHDQKQNQVCSVQTEFFLFKWEKVTINLREKKAKVAIFRQ